MLAINCATDTLYKISQNKLDFLRNLQIAISLASRFEAFHIGYFFANKSTIKEFYFLNVNKHHYDKFSLVKMLTDSFNFSVLMERINNRKDGMIQKFYNICSGK